MAKENIPKTMRDFVESMGKKDVEKTLSYLTEDAEWVTPILTLKGKEAIKKYLSSEAVQGMKVTETGNGIIVEENKAFFEHVIEVSYGGKNAKALAICAYEFNDEKIKLLRTVFDRLLVAQQVSGGIPKMLVNQIVKQTEKMVE
ncbi:MAG TPA: nuclear transport factor 2 family protein [Dehalococcoidia bacterium]|nr:nuclear transport factor 2 family protein [Dehalococcoidia bacterium]